MQAAAFGRRKPVGIQTSVMADAARLDFGIGFEHG